jgi:transposase
VLLVCEGHPISEVAQRLHPVAHWVRTWRDRFLTEGATGLPDRARQGRPRKLTAGDRQ